MFMNTCALITTVDQWRRDCKCLRNKELLPTFLVHGETGLVRRVIVECLGQEELDMTGGGMGRALVYSFCEDDQCECFKGVC